MKNKIFPSIILFIMLFYMNSFPREINIIPKPVSISRIDKRFILKNNCRLLLSSQDKEQIKIAEYFRETIRLKTGLKVAIKKGTSKTGIILSTNNKLEIPPEGYILKVTGESIKLIGKDCKGLFYGVISLEQMLTRDAEFYFQGCEITDYPRFAYRGFMLDASRHFQSVSFVKKILNIMSLLKLNKFHWHLADDEGWRIESKLYPGLNEIGSFRDSLNSKERNGYYTVSEIKEILKYAADRYIQVIPEIEMPGHSRCVMDSYPELLCEGSKNGKTFCAGNEKSYKFLKNVITEIIDIFKPEVIHVGGDERPKEIWEKCPKCKAMIINKGLSDENALQNYFMKDICSFISKKKIKTLAWAENIKGGIPTDQIVEGWHPGESAEAVKAGFCTVNADNLFTYFDYPSDERTSRPDWMPVLNMKKVYSFSPTPENLLDKEKKLVLGSECALWAEQIFENDVQYHLFPRILAFAEVAWSREDGKNYDEFLKRVIGTKKFISSYGFEYENRNW